MIGKLKRSLNNVNLHHSPESKSKLRQLREILWLGLRYRFSPIEYQAYRFYLQEKDFPDMMTYLSNYEISFKIRQRLINPKMQAMLTNKLLFHGFYQSYGIPTPRFYGYYHQESGFTADGHPLKNQEDFYLWIKRAGLKQMFIKPCGGKQGSGIMAINNIIENGGDLILEDVRGQIWQTGELVECLKEEADGASYPGYIFQEIIKQHPALNQVNSTSVNCCRLLTIRRPNGTVTLPFAVFRFGRSGHYVDSWSQGGIAYDIDRETGILTRGSYNPQWGDTHKVSHHPDSNIKLEGFQIPYWKELKEMVIKAAYITPDIRSIGWDVAVSPHGPILLEGNSLWSPILYQSMNGGFLNEENKETLRQYGFKVR